MSGAAIALLVLFLVFVGIVFFIWLVLWRPILWPALATRMGNHGIFFFRIPQNAIMAIIRNKKAWKFFVAPIQARFKEYEAFCFYRNLRHFAHLQSKTEVKINKNKMGDDFLAYCRLKLEELETGKGHTTLASLMKDEKLMPILEPIPVDMFSLVKHREFRRWLVEEDSRMFYLLQEGQDGLIPMPPFWISQVKTFEPYQEVTGWNKPEVKHSVNLRRLLLVFPMEKNKNKAIAGLYVPSQLTADPTDVEVELTGDYLPQDPEALLFGTENPISATFRRIVPVLASVIRSLSLRDFVKIVVADSGMENGQVEVTGIKMVSSRFLREVDRLFRIAIGQVRPFPKDHRLSEKQLERVKNWFPEGLIPCFDYESDNWPTAAKPQDSVSETSATQDEAETPDPAAENVAIFKALGFQKMPKLDAAGNIRWLNRYLDVTSVIGGIYELGYFCQFQISDLEPTDKEVLRELQGWLTAEYQTQKRIRLADALKVEKQKPLEGEAAGYEAMIEAFTKKANLEGWQAAQVVQALKFITEGLAGKNITFFLGGTGGTPLQQQVMDLISKSPDLLAQINRLKTSPVAEDGGKEKG